MTDLTAFQGAAKRLDDLDLPRIGHRIGVGEDEIHAFLDVEAAGSGFDQLMRPKMLFEPHIFHRLLAKRAPHLLDRAVKEGLAYRKWGTAKYPKESYTRLKKAMAIHPEIALLSASWGLGQIMGFNHVAAGYASVHDMVAAFMDDEAAHLEAAIAFIEANELDDELRDHDWHGFARGYNGASYRKHGYHLKLEAAFRKWSKIRDTPWSPEPDANVVKLDRIRATVAPNTNDAAGVLVAVRAILDAA